MAQVPALGAPQLSHPPGTVGLVQNEGTYTSLPQGADTPPPPPLLEVRQVEII
jgi:hypothetical protein